MERFEHGGDVYTHKGVLDFSANLNPLGIPERAKEALHDSVDAFDVYPDPACRALVSAIATFENVLEDYVVPCAGATDAFARLCSVEAKRAASTVLVCAPCYSGYEQAAEQAGLRVVRHELREEDNFDATDSLVARIDEGFDVVFLANPNNPTGLPLDDDVLYSALEAAYNAGSTVVLDECFIDLADGVGSNDLLDPFPNLVVVKALTKTFALAGLRVGYAMSSCLDTVEDLRASGQPWAVSTPAQVAGVAALQETNYVEHARTLVAAERAKLKAALESAGLRVIPSQANYLMFKGPHGLFDAFLERSILVRLCENYHGLDGSWYRIAVRTPFENERFVEVLKEVCP